MQFLSRLLSRPTMAVVCALVLGAAVLLPGLGSFGLWEPQERNLADKIAPRPEIAAKVVTSSVPGPVTLDSETCPRVAPKDAVARSLTNRAMVWGRDTIGASDAGRRLPLALLGLLTVLAAAGLAMRIAGARAGVLTALVLVSMPLLVLQSRQLLSEIGIPAGAALTLYGLVALGHRRGERVPPLWLAVVDAVVACVSLVLGIGVSFLAGGALLGLLIPLAAFALANGVGLRAIRSLGRGLAAVGTGIARRVNTRWAIGRGPAVPARDVLAWLELALGLAAILTGLVFMALLQTFGETSTAYGLVVAGVPIAAVGALQLARSDSATAITLADLKALLVSLAVIGVVAVLVYQTFSLVNPQPGMTPPQRAVLGKAIVASNCYSPALGAIWRPEDDLRYSFDSLFEQIAYGTFPWGVLGPVAIFALLSSADRGRRSLGGITLVWAAGAWLAGEVFQRKVGFTIYGGFPALAIAVGVWFDDVLSARAQHLAGEPRPTIVGALPRGTLMLVGLFVLLAVVDLGKDLQSFPERVTSLLTGGDALAYPKASRLLLLPTKLWWLVLGGLVALGAGLSLMLWREEPRARVFRTLARIATAVALGGTAVFAAFLAFGWQPTLATHMSSKAMFDTYVHLRRAGDQLVVMGDVGDAIYDYAPDAKAELVNTRDLVVQALGRPNRVFAIAPQTELCQLHREVGGKPYFVLDDRNTRSILLSNKLDGATDRNPLRTSILHAPPANLPFKPKGRVVYDNKVELIGWSMPRAVSRGDKFTVTTYYKILAPVGGAWRVLYHFDGSVRFNGDHEPIAGRCQTATWQPGDYIVDTYTVTAGGGAAQAGSYEVWTGFFTGSAPNWKNMPVSEAPPDMRDTTDRVKITTITLR